MFKWGKSIVFNIFPIIDRYNDPLWFTRDFSPPLLHSSTPPLLYIPPNVSPTPNTSCNDHQLPLNSNPNMHLPLIQPIKLNFRIGAWRMIGGCKISRNISPRILHIPWLTQSRNIMVGDPSPKSNYLYCKLFANVSLIFSTFQICQNTFPLIVMWTAILNSLVAVGNSRPELRSFGPCRTSNL